MKRVLLLCMSSFFWLTPKTQITWDGGGGDGLWNTASNWVGDIVPGPASNVLLDNSAVPASYIVTLPGGAVTVSINTLAITPTGANNITLSLPVANTANPGLAVTGAGDALLLNNGAILRNSSGGLAGTGVAIANTFRINNGGHYIHNTTRAHVAIVTQLSAVLGTELGQFEFDVPAGSYAVSLANRIYGSLAFSSVENGSAVTYLGSGGNPCVINGDLTINSGTVFSLSMSADFIVRQDLLLSASAQFNLQSASNNNPVRIAGDITIGGTITETGTGLPLLELNGTTNQNISVPASGSFLNSIRLVMNNTAGATLLTPLTLPYHLTLTSGKIATTTTQLLAMVDNATYTGGSTVSFVEGPMRKAGDEDFIFPVGVGTIYAPIGISGGTGSAAADAFTAEYKRANPQSIYGANYAPGINHISYVEYWMLERGASTAASKIITLDVHPTSFCKEIAQTFVSRWNGTQWTNEPSASIFAGTVGPYEVGAVFTNNPVTDFTPAPAVFTLATDRPFENNPLPIQLISFDAVKIGNQTAIIEWVLAECCSGQAKFTVEKSTDGRAFAAFAQIRGSETSRFYALYDNRLDHGVTYYRLKMTEPDGKTAYSRTVAVFNGAKGLLLTSMIPTMVTQSAFLTVTASDATVIDLLIIDSRGRTVLKQKQSLKAGSTSINLTLDKLPRGVYQVFAVSAQGEATNVIRFIRQ